MEMSYLLGIAGGCFTALLLLVCLCIYAVRGKKCCFKGKFLCYFTMLILFSLFGSFVVVCWFFCCFHHSRRFNFLVAANVFAFDFCYSATKVVVDIDAMFRK